LKKQFLPQGAAFETSGILPLFYLAATNQMLRKVVQMPVICAKSYVIANKQYKVMGWK
jgi:hypothetical protein